MLTGTAAPRRCPRWVRRIVLLATATLITLAMAAPPEAAADDTAVALKTPSRVKRRAHVAQIGDYGLTADARLPKDMHRREGGTVDDVGVVATLGSRVRILHDDDDARMLLWIDTADLAWAIVRETRVAGKGDVGVWLLPGAKVTADGRGARLRVRATFDGDVAISGMVPAASVSKTFAWGPAPAPMSDEHHAAAIHDAPDGRPLLATPNGLWIEIIAPGTKGWALAEHRTPTLRVRGWVRTAEFDERFDLGRITGGSGYGMSHVRSVDVTSGTCFHAGPGGPLVGVQLYNLERYSPGNENGWWELYVGNAWGLFTVHAHATSVDAAGKPVFTRCLNAR